MDIVDSIDMHIIRMICLGIGILAIQKCTPPPGWSGSPHILANFGGGIGKENSIVRVKLYEGKAIPISASSIYKYKTKNGFKFSRGKFTPSESGILTAQKGKIHFRNKVYHGQMKIYKVKSNFLYVNHLPTKDYLVSVIGHEMGRGWPIEALKAQAIVSRTYLVNKMNQNQKKKFDINATTKHQVYGGVLPKANDLYEAVSKTSRQIIIYERKVARVFFHSSCGGTTASSKEAWSLSIQYLKIQEQNFCKNNPAYYWKHKVPLKKAAAILGVKNIHKIEISKRTNSKRAKNIKISTGAESVSIQAKNFRSKLGPVKVRSTLFGVRIRNGFLEVAGRGYGHGVGMCQWGSRKLAASKRKSYREILNYYFPRTSIATSSRTYL